VVVPKRYVAETAAKAQKRFDDEDAKRQKLASGVLGLDMYNMREPLAKAGLVYVDNPHDV
jgi:4-hydroxy-4-methyl-2-oxoglutarate aldolase